MAYVQTAPREPLDLPFAGQESKFAEYDDFVEKVRELVGLGYRIPDEVAADLALDGAKPLA
jgi:hypothetical protein